MGKKHMDYCHICGKYDNLSFEHIPPENALNKGQAKVYIGHEALKRSKGENARYQNQQQGMGKYSLCESCNNITGAWYANVYVDVANDIAKSLSKQSPLEHGDVISFSLSKVPALAFVKQVITMFCSLLPLPEVQRLGFDKLILDRESNTIDKTMFDLKMYLTPLNVGQLMIGPMVIMERTETGYESIVVSDLGVYPFGFILNLTPEHPIPYGTSIMGLLDAEYDKKYNMEWKLIYLERASTELPLPLYFKPISNMPDEATENR